MEDEHQTQGSQGQGDQSSESEGQNQPHDHGDQKGQWATSVDDILDQVSLEIGDYINVTDSMGPQSVTVDEESEGTADQKLPPKLDDENDVDKKDDQEDTPLIRHMRKTIDGLQKRIKTLEVSKDDDVEKKGDEQQPPLTDEQILAIMEEHEGDPKVMLNVIKYMMERGVKDAAKASQDLENQKQTIELADKHLSGIFRAWGDDEFNERLDTDFPASRWMLEGHPYARQLQGMIALASTFPAAVQHGVQQAIRANESSKRPSKDQIEEKRQDFIRQTGGLPKNAKAGTGGVATLTAEQVKRAQEIGLKSPAAQKLYAQFLGKKG